MAAYTCDKCGHMMLDDQLREEARYSVLVADLRKLVEALRFEANAIQPMDVGSTIKAQAKADLATRIEYLINRGE